MSAKESLHNHRVNYVRPQARVAQLLYGYVRGVAYSTIEKSTRQPLDAWWMKQIREKAKRHGVDMTGFDDWRGGVMQHTGGNAGGSGSIPGPASLAR